MCINILFLFFYLLFVKYFVRRIALGFRILLSPHLAPVVHQLDNEGKLENCETNSALAMRRVQRRCSMLR
jgi:hypothetical protein